MNVYDQNEEIERIVSEREHAQAELIGSVERVAQQIARQEIASLCGLILKRLGNRDIAFQHEESHQLLRSIFGEALADFSGHTGSGGEPGA